MCLSGSSFSIEKIRLESLGILDLWSCYKVTSFYGVTMTNWKSLESCTLFHFLETAFHRIFQRKFVNVWNDINEHIRSACTAQYNRKQLNQCSQMFNFILWNYVCSLLLYPPTIVNLTSILILFAFFIFIFLLCRAYFARVLQWTL